MNKYKFLVLVFVFGLLADPLGSVLGIDVQTLFRVPLINVRWIDISILAIVFLFFLNLIFNQKLLFNNNKVVILCLIFLFFEVFQLAKSWLTDDLESQVSRFICTLGLFIIIDLSFFKIEKEKIIGFLKYLAVVGALGLIVSNVILLVSFISGNIVYGDSGIRIGLNITGSKETVEQWVLISYVYAFGLYYIFKSNKLVERVIFIIALITIILFLVLSFSRGGLFTLTLITLIYIGLFSKNAVKAFLNLFVIAIFFVILYFLFGEAFGKRGYDPVAKIVETAEFAIDFNSPDWDKGRSISRKYAIEAWKDNLLTGVGYDDLSNYGLPSGTATAHNFIITSLFHRGIIGTAIYLLILIILYNDAVKLWIRTSKQNLYENDIMKLLIIVSFFWFVRFWTQEIIWEKYSLSLQFLYIGLISNYYRQIDY